MAFNINSYSRVSGSANNDIITAQDGTAIGAPAMYTYVSLQDAIATISAADYFNPLAAVLNIGDLFYIVGTDTSNFFTVTSLQVQPPHVVVATGVVTGDVGGPASAINNDIAVFNGTTGKLIKDGGVTISYIQAGTLIYAADGGATDSYAITLSPVPAAYVVGMTVNFKANTANTGTASLNVNGLGAITILKSHDQTLATGDIEAGQIVNVVYDGTNFQMQSQVAVTLPSGAANTVLQGQGLGSNPAYSTATYPATTTVNQFLYSSATNTVTGLATIVSATVVTDAGGIPSLSQTLPTTVQSNITQLGAQSQALNMNTHLVNGVVDPVSAQDAATKNYVDNVAAGLNPSESVTAATTGALTVTYSNGVAGIGATLTNAGAQAAFSIDGQSPAITSRVLIKNQASSFQNGIYTVTIVGTGATNWVLTRALDFDTPANINASGIIPVINGTINGNTAWLCTSTVTTVGTDAITFTQFGISFPVTVPNGGTGFTSTTAYGAIFGGTTSTGALQNAGAGPSGTVLIGGGASALPTWSTTTYPATTAINRILYSAASNTINGLPTANFGFVTTGSTGIPSVAQTYSNIRTIAQSGHGLAAFNVVKLSGASTYATAQANSAANAEVVGIVISVIDANNFLLQFGGSITGASGWTVGAMYLDPSVAGGLTTTKPTASGQVIKPVLIADTTSSGYWTNQLGVVL